MWQIQLSFSLYSSCDGKHKYINGVCSGSRQISPRKDEDISLQNYSAQISPEHPFVTLGAQTETGCIFNEVVSGGHCETRPDPLSFSLCVVNISASGWESEKPGQRAHFPRVSINESPEMRPKCCAGCEWSEIWLCIRHMPPFHFPICSCNETDILTFHF